jgi:hypothetical protein
MDFAWPPLDYCTRKDIQPRWYRPGPLFEARGLGRWPSHSSGVWSEALWQRCFRAEVKSGFGLGEGEHYNVLSSVVSVGMLTPIPGN